MSQPSTAAPAPSDAKASKGLVNMSKASLVVVSHQDTTMFIGGDGLDMSNEVFVALTLARNAGREIYPGLNIQFPMRKPDELDSTGFGVSYTANLANPDAVELAQRYKLLVKFPRYGITTTVSKVPGDLAIHLPVSVRDKCCLLKVKIDNVDDIRIEGLGMPRLNSNHPCDAWLRGVPVVGDLTLLDILTSQEQSFIVKFKGEALEKELKTANWPAAFKYPWGEQHYWDEARFAEQAKENPGGRFFAAWTYATDNDHAAVLSQSLGQDIVWVGEAAKSLADVTHLAYVAESPPDSSEWDCLVVPCDQQFRDAYEYAWRRLTSCKLYVVFFDVENKERSKHKAEICERPQDLDVMQGHTVAAHELVLRLSPGQYFDDPTGEGMAEFEIKKYSARTLALQALKRSNDNWNSVSLQFDVEYFDYRRKCEAVNDMFPGERPSNPKVFGLELPDDHRDPLVGTPEALQHVAERQALARAVIRGTGFHGISWEQPWPNSEASSTFPGLPMVNLFRFENEAERDATLECMLPGDRERFSKYLSKRHLGLALITAGPGFGKTTALAVATLGLARSVDRVYMSAPTHVACDNATERLVSISTDVTRRVNANLQPDEEPLCRRLMVVRVYKRDDELAAFMRILQSPEAINDAAPTNGKHTSHWKLDNSLAFWLLKALGSAVVPALEPEDCPRLHEARRNFQGDKTLDNLFKVATMAITWEEYVKAGQVPDQRIQKMMGYVLHQADVVCSTPAESSKQPCSGWKREKARGFAIDEAACMSRPDFYSVWGNTMMPCVMAGDRLQLDPAVMSFTDVINDGVYRNRHGPDAKISIMEFLQGSGWPVFRMLTQLRMARGLFTLSQEVIYPELRAQYGAGSDISLPRHASGRAMETFLLARFRGLKPSPRGTLREVFVHCPGSDVVVNAMTKSKSSPDQVEVALRLLNDLVQNTQVDPSEIVIIAPYAANVAVVEHQLRLYDSLVGQVMVSTVDSIQGKERSIAVVIMGTNERTGPGFTRDAKRLNVAMSRHTSFLLLVGDINVAGDFRSGTSTTNTRGRGGGQGGRGGRGGGRGGSAGGRGGSAGGRGGSAGASGAPQMDLWKLAGQRFNVPKDDGEMEGQQAVKLRAALILIHRAGRVVTHGE